MLDNLMGPRMTPLTLEQAEELIIAWGPLSIEAYIHDPKLPMKDFIKDEFFKQVTKYSTIDVGTGYTQTPANRNRSLVDLYRTTKHYYPEARLADCIAALKELDDAGMLGHLMCPDIKRMVLRNRNYHYYTRFMYHDPEVINEFGYHGLRGMYPLLEQQEQTTSQTIKQ